MVGEIVQAQRVRVSNQRPEDAATARVVPDRANRLVVGTLGDELNQADLVEGGPRPEHAESRVPRVDELAGGRDDAPENDGEAVRGHCRDRLEQAPNPAGARHSQSVPAGSRTPPTACDVRGPAVSRVNGRAKLRLTRFAGGRRSRSRRGTCRGSRYDDRGEHREAV
jgi:hypothetical protein